jgi:hypothetical protein
LRTPKVSFPNDVTSARFYIVSVIGWIILLIACINFMNLSTARAGQRAREVGVRKTLGAMRKGLMTWQDLSSAKGQMPIETWKSYGEG